MKFLKKSEVVLKNGGYLTSKDGESVTHNEFVALQTESHYLVNLANTVRATNFEVKEPITFDQVVAQVKAQLNDEKRVYVEAPKKIKRATTDKLAEEALAWVGFQKDKTVAEKLNNTLQRFNVIAEFEEHGLFFTEGIVKLKNIYTLEQIIEAVTTLQPHLD